MFRILVVADHRVETLPAIRAFEHMISTRDPAKVMVFAFCNADQLAENGECHDIDWDIIERASIMGCEICVSHVDPWKTARLVAGNAALIILPPGVKPIDSDLRCRDIVRALGSVNRSKKISTVKVAVINALE